MAGSEFQAQPPQPGRRPARPPRPDDYDDYDDDEPSDAAGYDDPVQTLVPYRNLRALFAYYCGVFSFVPIFGVILTPVALILGIFGYRHSRLYPATKGSGHAVAGILFGLLGLVFNCVLLYFCWVYINGRGPAKSPFGQGGFGPGN